MPGRSPLEQRLLHDPIADDDAPTQRWAYPAMATLVLSLFIAYHLTAVLAHTLPTGELGRPFRAFLARHASTDSYLGAAGIASSWGVFAPEPPSRNVFTRVLVEDAEGQEWDLGHDILGRRTYPHLIYDRWGKINRQMLIQREYQPIYAGWVCRDWERRHGGAAARAVRLSPVYTQIPPPRAVYANMGYDPRSLDLHEAKQEVYGCASIAHGQTPSRLRARLGLAPLAPGAFRDVPRRSWAAQPADRAPADVPAPAPSVD